MVAPTRDSAVIEITASCIPKRTAVLKRDEDGLSSGLPPSFSLRFNNVSD